MGKPKKNIPGGFKQKHPKNRKNKTQLVFDEKAREEWLTGFSKRKTERKKRAQEEIITSLKEEKRRLKQKQRDEKEERLKHFKLKDVEAIARQIKAPPKTVELPAHIVTITDMAEVDFGSTGTILGTNDEEDEEEDGVEIKKKNTNDNTSDEESDEEGGGSASSSKKKRKWNAKRHVNYSHKMMNTKIPAHIKKTREFRAEMKRKAAKQGKRRNHKP